MKKEAYTRILAALSTAFNANDTIDTVALSRIVNSLLKRGVEGFYVGVSTGKCFLLSDDERKEILEMVLAVVDGKAPVIAHVGAFFTSAAISLAKHATKVGATAISATLPLYFNNNLDEIQRYYIGIAEASGLPIIIYNIPAFSRKNFSMQDGEKLLNISGVARLKHTSMNLYELERICKEFREKVIFSGYDEVLLAAFSLGAEGMTGSTVNLMSELFLGMRSALFSGDITKAQKLQDIANSVIECLFGGSFFPALKYELALSGLPCGECRKPFQSILDIKKALIASKLVEYGIVKHGNNM